MWVKRLLLILFMLFLPIAHAADYYADIEAEVDETGFIVIKGDTNHPSLLTEGTEEHTSKKQSYWLFDISTEEIFSNYFVLLSLPEGASVNYVKSSGNFRIESVGKGLAVRVFGENEKMSIKVQYQIVDYKKRYIGIIITSSIVIIGIFLYFIIKSKKKRIKNKVEDSKVKKEEIKHDFAGLTVRQKKIMKLLIEKKKPMTQAEIEKEMKLPKSSVSRNIRTLELKGRIDKEKTGMSNIIKLKRE